MPSVRPWATAGHPVQIQKSVVNFTYVSCVSCLTTQGPKFDLVLAITSSYRSHVPSTEQMNEWTIRQQGKCRLKVYTIHRLVTTLHLLGFLSVVFRPWSRWGHVCIQSDVTWLWEHAVTCNSLHQGFTYIFGARP